MPGPKDKKLCLRCNTLKGLSAFKDGVPVCKQCRNKLKNVGPPPLASLASLPPLPSLPITEHPVDISHIEPSKKLYFEYVQTHPNQIQPGEWVYLIEGDLQVYTAPTYHQATEAAKVKREGKRWFCTQHQSSDNLDVLIGIRTSLNIKTRQISSVRAVTSVNIRNSYTETQLEAYGLLREEKNEEKVENCIIDTGATVCTIPYTVAEQMKLRAEDHRTYFADAPPGQASAVGNTVHIYFLDVEMQIPGLRWRKPRTVTLKSGIEDRLIGFSYLKYCKQIWTGAVHVEITDLDQIQETSDVKEPVSINVLGNSDLERVAHESQVGELKKLIEERETLARDIRQKMTDQKDHYTDLLNEQEAEHDQEMERCQAEITHWRDLAKLFESYVPMKNSKRK
jgi:hypothetical protein